MYPLKGKSIQIIILSLLISISVQHVFSQKLKLASEVYTEHRYYPLRGEVFYKAYTQVKGNAYLTDDWIVGDIFLENGAILNDVKFKADMYSHDLLVYNEYLKRVILLERSHVNGFVFTDKGRISEFKRIRAEKNLRMGRDELFLEVLKEGHVSLYRLYFRDIIPLKTPEMPYIDEFVKGEDYYLVYQNEWQQIRLRRGALIKKFPAYKNEIKLYARKNKLKLKQEKDFIQAVGHISSIIELVDKSK